MRFSFLQCTDTSQQFFRNTHAHSKEHVMEAELSLREGDLGPLGSELVQGLFDSAGKYALVESAHCGRSKRVTSLRSIALLLRIAFVWN